MANEYFILDGLEKDVYSKDPLSVLVARRLSITTDDIADIIILRESLDARKKNRLKWTYQIAVKLVSVALPKGFREYEALSPDFSLGTYNPSNEPLIIGSGPAGLFSAYILVQKGYKPIILEQGRPINERISDVEKLWDKGIIDPKSNVVFGEGGAGAFSDGKLTARNRSPETDLFYKTLIKFGANKEIAWQAKPHLGTDGVTKIVPNLTAYLKANGALFKFNTKVIDLQKAGGGISVKTDSEEFFSDSVILAIGHSADDLFHTLHARGVAIIKKTFAVGVRIEHPRRFIDSSQYGEKHDISLTGPADYKLTTEIEPGRGVYSFCVCPGGRVINASSGSGGVSINGMSMSVRDGDFTNGAIVATVLPQDIPDEPLAGLLYRKEMELRCAAQGGLFAPCQKASDFIRGGKSKHIESSYRPGYFSDDLNSLLSKKLADGLKKGLFDFDRKIKGFIDKGTLVAPETGTSSPVRIVRNPETFESISLKGLYPIGEGAGYAGGIVSSAADGIRLALMFKAK